MYKKIKNLTALLVTLVLLIGTLGGCSNSKSDDTTDTALQYPSEEETSSNTEPDRYGVKEISEGTANETAGIEHKQKSTHSTSWDSNETYVTEDSREYNGIYEAGFQSVSNNPLSTFGADVDTASYSNIRSYIKNREVVPADAVRVEEMINYFQYDYNTGSKKDPFTINTEYSSCPWNSNSNLLHIGIKTQSIDFTESRPSNLVFLLDVSGSMYDENKLPLVQKAFSMLTENLSKKDTISLVTYAGSDEILLAGASGDNKSLILESINLLSAGGSTNGSAGIITAYELAERFFIQNGNNRVILATDGDLNVGTTSEAELIKLIEDKKRSGVFLSVLGFGTDNLKDNKLEALADKGNGNYAFIDSANEAKKVLVEEMGATLITVAKDVKFQVEFNPAMVESYRLIGYENRAMAAQDFNDDTKDGGDIGAGHTVTVLYEIIPAQTTEGISLKYQKEKNTPIRSEELLTISIRYKDPSKEKSKLIEKSVTQADFRDYISKDFNFASCVAEFAMLLRGSEYIGDLTYNTILSQLNKEDYSDDIYKQEFIELVKMQRILSD